VDTRIIRKPGPKAPPEERLEKLEERLAHELMDEEERQELNDQVLRLRRRLGC
jgi:hypothetical protein